MPCLRSIMHLMEIDFAAIIVGGINTVSGLAG